MSLSNLLF